jgi:hypothetical protein
MREESHFMREKKCVKKVTSCVMRESKQKCENFTVIAGNLEGHLGLNHMHCLQSLIVQV